MGRRIVDGEVVEVGEGEGFDAFGGRPRDGSVPRTVTLCETPKGLRVVGVYTFKVLNEVRIQTFGTVRATFRGSHKGYVEELAKAYGEAVPEADRVAITALEGRLAEAKARIKKLERELAERALTLPTLEDDDDEATT